mmetsp:Transcript_17281/g.39114  ORF Transcript_17281/g.39114 Transcript_17281/m.39114 type:complete len:293 (-) Transcript_17281:89-967(-)
MDDDAPLSALAKAPKFDDDTPLASLADVGKPRAGPKAGAKAGSSPAGKVQPKGSPKAAAPAKGKGKGKGTPTKRKAGGSSSSSSSSDSDDSSSSGSDQKAQGRKKGPVGKGKKMKLLQKMQTDDGMENDGGGAVKKRDRTVKEQVVADLLCRWWYVLPEWPPRDEAYYKAELAKRSLRKVTIEEWEWVPEEDAKGHKKVYELSQFRGLFRSSNGDLVDVRPKETCPCYANLMKKDLADLYDLLVKAFENQMKDLQNSKYNETQLEQELKVRMTSARERAYQAKQLAGAKKGN